MQVNDQNQADFEHLRLMRNNAGEYIAKYEFNKAFEAILDLQRDIKKRQLHQNTFTNILNEIIAIGCELSGDAMMKVKFYQYINGRLDTRP